MEVNHTPFCSLTHGKPPFPGNIRVFCRCRPLSKAEVSDGCSTVIDFDVAKDGELGILNGSSTKKTFKFDRVYTPRDDQGVPLYTIEKNK